MLNFEMIAKLMSFCLLLIFEKCQSCECPLYELGGRQSYRCLSSFDCYEDKLVRDFCSADFCIEVLIDSDKTTNGAKYKNIIYSNYTFRPIRTIRFSPKSMKALRMNLFFTPTDVSRCGLEVKRRHIYYLCGHIIEDNAVVTSCDFAKRAERLTFTERVFFFGGYRKTNCIQFITDYRPIIDYNIKQQYVTKAPYFSGMAVQGVNVVHEVEEEEEEEDATKSELELKDYY